MTDRASDYPYVGVIGKNIVLEYESNAAAIAACLTLSVPSLLVGPPVRALLHEMRVYAQHAKFCNYAPTYPETPVSPCDCGFDAVLDAYDRLAAE